MTHQPLPPESPLRIKTPCPKTWDQLTGGESKRYCSECSLHVHNAAQLTRDEAQALVANADARVCMRMELDLSGAPIHRASRATFAGRVTRWALTTAAGLLAACQRGESLNTPEKPALNPTTTQNSVMMGVVCPPREVVGDVATPPVKPPEMIGEVAAPQPPQPPPVATKNKPKVD